MIVYSFKTRKHSSRTRTARSSTICATGEVQPWRRYGPGDSMVPGGTALPPVNRLTDTCENISFPQLPLRSVKIVCWLRKNQLDLVIFKFMLFIYQYFCLLNYDNYFQTPVLTLYGFFGFFSVFEKKNGFTKFLFFYVWHFPKG